MNKGNKNYYKNELSNDTQRIVEEVEKLIEQDGITNIKISVFFEYVKKVEDKFWEKKNRNYYLHNISLDNISNDKQVIDNIERCNCQGIEEKVIYNRQKERELITLRSCTKMQRDRYIKHVYYGYSFAETARMENASEGAIRKTIKKVLLKIRYSLDIG